MPVWTFACPAHAPEKKPAGSGAEMMEGRLDDPSPAAPKKAPPVGEAGPVTWSAERRGPPPATHAIQSAGHGSPDCHQKFWMCLSRRFGRGTFPEISPMTAPPPQAFQKAAACNAGRMRLFQMKRSNQRQVRCVGQSVTTLPSQVASWQVLRCRGWPHGEGRAPPRPVACP
jgi:hypothetical protein